MAFSLAPHGILLAVPVILLATDAAWIYDEVDAGLSDPATTVLRVRAGQDVLPAVRSHNPDLVIVDLQIGNMGGIAVSLAIRQEEGMDRLTPRPVMLLLDRAVDVFLAQTSGADGWMIKPVDGFRLRRAANILLAGDPYTEGVPAPQG